MTEGKKAAEEPKARKKTSRWYVVLKNVTLMGPPDSEPVDAWVLTGAVCEGTDEARKWIKASGEANAIYQVACFIGAQLKVEIEQIDKRSLV